GVRDRFSANYPQSIIFPDISTPLFQPLYEMLLLSRTTKVVGTYSSTFSYEACLFRGTDLELFEEGRWKSYRFSSIRSDRIELAAKTISHFASSQGSSDLASNVS